MKKLKLDHGIREYALGAGVLRFNPQDPNLYARFLEMAEQLPEMERELLEKAAELPQDRGLMKLLQQTDARLKELLNRVFPGNDFDLLLEGVNLLAVGTNGERVITNLLQLLEPILCAGAEEFAQVRTEQAVEKARQRRAGL